MPYYFTLSGRPTSVAKPRLVSVSRGLGLAVSRLATPELSGHDSSSETGHTVLDCLANERDLPKIPRHHLPRAVGL